MFRRLRDASIGWPVLVMTLGLSATYFSWYYTSRAERAEAADRAHLHAVRARDHLRAELISQVEILSVVGSLYAHVPGFADEDLRSLYADVVPDEAPLRALAWVRRVPGDERDGWELSWASAHPGLPSTGIHTPDGRPADPAPYHDVIEHVAGPTDHALLCGLDVNGLRDCRATLQRAVAADGLAASSVVPLLEPSEARQVLVCLPVYAPGDSRRTLEQRQQAVAGFVLGAFDAEAIVSWAFAPDKVDADLAELAVSVSLGVEALGDAGNQALPDAEASRASTDLFQRTWIVETRATLDPPRTVQELIDRPSLLLPAAVFTVMTLAAAIVRALMRQTSVIRLRVAEQTAELRDKNLVLERKEGELHEANRRLREMSQTDPLTGVLNRRAFEDQLENERERSRRQGIPFGLLFFDVDHFKGYNDQYGHVAGDEVLRRVATTLRNEARRIDCVARYGGEEFVVLASNTDAAGLLALGERIRQRVQDCSIDNAASPHGVITVSGGGSLWGPESGHEACFVVEVADRCLYQAKETGRNRVVMRM